MVVFGYKLSLLSLAWWLIALLSIDVLTSTALSAAAGQRCDIEIFFRIPGYRLVRVHLNNYYYHFVYYGSGGIMGSVYDDPNRGNVFPGLEINVTPSKPIVLRANFLFGTSGVVRQARYNQGKAYLLAALLLPYWLVALVAGVIASVIIGSMAVANLKSRNLRLGLCRMCGYDLRASPGRCPECGADPPGRPGAPAPPDAPGPPGGAAGGPAR